MNKVIMTPILTKDAVFYETRKGKSAHFRGAVKRPYVNKKGEVLVDYFNFTAFGSRAEFLERFGKQNTKFEIVGYLKNANYEADDGEMVYKDDIIIQEIDFAERKKNWQEEDIDDEDLDDENLDDEEFFNIDEDDDTPFK